MKVLFLIGGLGTGGAARQFMELVKRIKNHEPEIEPIVCTIEENHENYSMFFDEFGIPHYAYQRKSALDYNVIIKIIKLIRAQKVSIVQTWQPLAGLYGLFAAKICRKRIVCSSIRDAIPKISFKKKLIYYVSAYLSNIFISNSKSGFDVQFKKWRKNFRVITNGIDLKRFEKIANSDVKYLQKKYNCSKFVNLIFAANLRKDRDLFTVIRGLDLLKKRKRKLQLFVIGEGEIKKAAMRYAIKLHLEDNIHFLGYQQNIETYIKAFDISVLLVESDISEGISNFLLESIISKNVVIATKGGGNTELIRHGETGYLVNSHDAQGLAEILDEIMCNDQSRLLEKAYNHVVQAYNIERYVKEYISLYHELDH